MEMPEQVVAVHLHVDQEHENTVEEEKIRKGRTDDQPPEIQLGEVIFQYPLLGIVGCDAHVFRWNLVLKNLLLMRASKRKSDSYSLISVSC